MPVTDTVVDELKALLLEFGEASGDSRTAEELIDIPAELWTEAPDSDDDECELTMALADCAEPNELEAQDDDSVGPLAMSLKDAKAASIALRMFLEENKCEEAASHMESVSATLSRLTVTALHSQARMDKFFAPAPRPGPL